MARDAPIFISDFYTTAPCLQKVTNKARDVKRAHFKSLVAELFTNNFSILKIGILWNFRVSVVRGKRELHNRVVAWKSIPGI